MRDLIVLAADKNIEFATKGILGRFKSLRIQNISYQIYVHPEHDPGCLLRGHDFLRPFVSQYRYALVILDHDGTGKEQNSRDTLEAEMEDRLSRSGWDLRAAAIIIDPELDVWVWNDSPHVDEILGWKDNNQKLRAWLQAESFLNNDSIKPDRPKEVMELVLKTSRKQRSSSLYFRLAEVVSLTRCEDAAFIKLRDTLQKWFPEK